MPIMAEYELICVKCGKKFKFRVNDAVMPKDAIMLKNPLCKLCKVKTDICSRGGGVPKKY